jgi:8-oxo-dGTP pyrophosphatase MutT (NUDIX family)
MALPSDRWTICRLGHVHWGALGGAGLLFRHAANDGAPRYLLAQRARDVDEGMRWGIPGGATREGESPEQTARREVEEELGVMPSYRVTGKQTQDCGGGWVFQVICADVDSQFDVFCVRETETTGWFTREQMAHPDCALTTAPRTSRGAETSGWA